MSFYLPFVFCLFITYSSTFLPYVLNHFQSKACCLGNYNCKNNTICFDIQDSNIGQL